MGGPLVGIGIGGGAAGGVSVGYGTYAARPISPSVGDTYICSDGPHRLVCVTNGAWKMTIPGLAGEWSPMVAGDWTAHSVGATVTQVGAGVRVSGRVKKSAASANFRVEIATAGNVIMTTESAYFGPVMLEDLGATIKAVFSYFRYNTIWHMQRDSNWGTSYHSTPFTAHYISTGPYGAMYSEYDGSNLIFGNVINESTRQPFYTDTAGYVVPTEYGLADVGGISSLVFLGYREVAL